MPPALEIRIRSDDRVFGCGKTGSGKTFAFFHICKPIRRLVVLDPKARIDADEWRLMPWDREARRLLDTGNEVRTLVRAPIGPGAAERWDEVYKAVLAAGNCTLYVDEVYGVTETTRPSDYLTAIWTRGRELGIGAFSASQRPVWVPIVMLSEASHFFCFRLRVMDDRRRMAEHMGPEVLLEVPREDEHGFYYMRETDHAPVYLPRLPIGAGKKESSNAASTRHGRRQAERV